MNWYKTIFAGAQGDYLHSLGASQEIIAYIVSQPNMQYLINAFRKNPQMTLEQVKEISNPNKRELTELESTFIDTCWANSGVGKWALIQLQKMFRTAERTGQSFYPDVSTAIAYRLTLQHTCGRMNEVGQQFAQIGDWVVRSEDEFDLLNYTYEQAVVASDAWHERMAKGGAGKEYEEKNIVYGPEWVNRGGDKIDEFEGWTIQNVKTANDLEVEGHLMDHCFAPGALVRTKSGYKSIEDIKTGEEVLCEGGGFNRVLRLFKNQYNGPMIKFATRFGIKETLVTLNHEFVTMIKNQKHFESKHQCRKHICGQVKHNSNEIHNLKWEKIGNLNSWSYLLSTVPRQFADINTVKVPEQYTNSRRRGNRIYTVNSDFLWIIGMFIAEGSATGDQISFGLSKDERNYVDKIMSFFTDNGFYAKIRKDKEDYGGMVVVIRSRMLSDWFSNWLGKGCDNKHIPSELLNLPNEKVYHLYKGVLDGDGCESHKVLNQTSPVLALQMTEIGLRLGIVPTISHRTNKGKKDTYPIEGIDTSLSYKKSKVEKQNIWNLDNNLLIHPHVFEKVKYTGPVYNLEVENVHSYTIQNILVHNCVGGYCDDVERGDSIIYSLRDPKNMPHVTIEVDGHEGGVNQVQGHSNSEPKDKYKDMIKHWIQNDKNSPKFMDDPEEGILKGYWELRNLRDMSPRLLLESLESRVAGGDEYGLRHGDIYYDMTNVFDLAWRSVGKNAQYGMYAGDGGLGEFMVEAALDSDDLSKEDDNKKCLRSLIDEMTQVEEDSRDEYQRQHIDVGIPYPQEEEYENPAEYEEALEDYQKQEDELLSGMFPFPWVTLLWQKIQEKFQQRYDQDFTKWYEEYQERRREEMKERERLRELNREPKTILDD
jgi:hypothetical protein